MTNTTADGGGPLWLTRPLAAELVGLSPRHFDEVFRLRLPAADSRGEGRKLRYHGPGVVAAWLAYKLEQLGADRRGAAVGAKDTTGPASLVEEENAADSPALERLRMAKAIGEELNLEERVRYLVQRPAIVQSLVPAAAAMRGTGIRLAKKFGNDAGEMFNEAVDDFARALERHAADALGEPGRPDRDPRAGAGPGGDDADAAAPHAG